MSGSLPPKRLRICGSTISMGWTRSRIYPATADAYATCGSELRVIELGPIESGQDVSEGLEPQTLVEFAHMGACDEQDSPDRESRQQLFHHPGTNGTPLVIGMDHDIVDGCVVLEV